MFSKRILYIFCFLLSCGTVFAQQGKQYFVYIQSESGKPFYVRVNGQLLSGTASGYIIIPGLHEGTNNLVVGFPKNEFPEQHFPIKLGDNKDEGYLFRNAGNGKFELYNLQSYQVIRAGIPENNNDETLASNTESQPPPPVNTPASAPASTVSAQATSSATPAADNRVPAAVMPPARDTLSSRNAEVNMGDTVTRAMASQKTAADTGNFASMLNRVSGKSQPQPVSGVPAGSGDSSAAVLTRVPAKDTANTASLAVTSAQTAPQATPVDTAEGGEGLQAAAEQEKEARKRKYHRGDKEQPQFITYLPGGDSAATAASTGVNATEDSATASTEDTPLRRHKKKTQEEAAGNENNNPAPAVSRGEDRTTMVNSDCGSAADEKEFQKVRRKIAVQKDDAGMLREAGRYFASTCFSTAQIRSIAYLFMTDEYRYKFLDMAYARTYDSGNFPGLVKVLSDPYYVGRFRAMIRK